MDAEWLAVIVASVGIAVALITLRFAAQQTKALATQTKIQNNLAASSELRSMHVHLHAVLGYLIEHPHLRPYFYAGADWRTVIDTTDRARVDTIAEMFADVLELGLFTTEQHPDTVSSDDWSAYASFVLMNSPVIATTVAHNAAWWPKLEALRRT